MILLTNHFDFSTVLFHSSPPVPSDLSPVFNLEVSQLSKCYAVQV